MASRLSNFIIMMNKEKLNMRKKKRMTIDADEQENKKTAKN